MVCCCIAQYVYRGEGSNNLLDAVFLAMYKKTSPSFDQRFKCSHLPIAKLTYNDDLIYCIFVVEI